MNNISDPKSFFLLKGRRGMERKDSICQLEIVNQVLLQFLWARKQKRKNQQPQIKALQREGEQTEEMKEDKTQILKTFESESQQKGEP